MHVMGVIRSHATMDTDKYNTCFGIKGKNIDDKGNIISARERMCINTCIYTQRGTAVAQWLRCCATNRKVVDSIPDGVIGIFH